MQRARLGGKHLLAQLAGHGSSWQVRICSLFALFAPRWDLGAKPNRAAAKKQQSSWREPSATLQQEQVTSPAQAQLHQLEMEGGQGSSGPFLSSLSYSSELRPRSRPWRKLSAPFSNSSWMALKGNTSPVAAHGTLCSSLAAILPVSQLWPLSYGAAETTSEWTGEPDLPLSRSGLPTSRVPQAAGSPHAEPSPRTCCGYAKDR